LKFDAFDNQDSRLQILFYCTWANQITVHSTIKVTPASIVSRRDILFDLSLPRSRKKLENVNNRLQTPIHAKKSNGVKHEYKVKSSITWQRDTQVKSKTRWTVRNITHLLHRHLYDTKGYLRSAHVYMHIRWYVMAPIEEVSSMRWILVREPLHTLIAIL
jgi:hypothetical protein